MNGKSRRGYQRTSHQQGLFTSMARALNPTQSDILKPTSRKLKKNSLLFQEGDTVSHVYEVITGTLKTTKTLFDGRQQVIGFFNGGDVIGLPLVSEAYYSTEAVTASFLNSYPISQLEELMENSAVAAKAIIALVHEDSVEHMDHMVSLGRRRPAERVASFLLKWQNDLAEKSEGTALVELPMSRIDIADYLGLTQETVCRVLSKFRQEGLISRPEGHRVNVRNYAMLSALADDGVLH